eukprot:3465904-Heterocapsa_arctica.AAC.1
MLYGAQRKGSPTRGIASNLRAHTPTGFIVNFHFRSANSHFYNSHTSQSTLPIACPSASLLSFV